MADISPQTSRLRQVAGFTAGILAFSALAILLAMIFRGLAEQSSDGGRSLLPSSDAAALPDNLLIAISTVYDEPEETWETKTGRVTTYDAQSGAELFSVDAGSNVDAALTPDGTRLYIHSWSPTGDRDDLVAINTASGEEVWGTTGKNKVGGMGGFMPSALAASPDGTRVYVFEPDWNRPPEQPWAFPYHVEIVDARDGDRIADIDAPNCPAQLFPSSDGRTLYVLCLGSGWWQSIAIDAVSGEVVTDLPFAEMRASIQDAVSSPDNRRLYVASASSITTIDMDQRRIIAEEPFEFIDTYTVALRLIAVSQDGKRVAVGLLTNSQPSGEPDLASEIVVLDTNTWREIDRVSIDPPVNALTLARGTDFDSVLAARNDLELRTQAVERGTILRLNLNGESTVLATKPNEEILRIFSHSVVESTTEAQSVEQDADVLLSPLHVATTSNGSGLEVRPVDSTTMEPLPGYEPISLGHHFTHAFSPDGRTMAVIIWPVETGGAGWGGKLYLIDLTDWTMTDTGVEIEQNTGTLLYSANGRQLYWTLRTGSQSELHRFDLDTSSQTTAIEFPTMFSPAELRLFRAGTRLVAWGPMVNSNYLVEQPPHAIIVDLDQDEIAVDIEVPNVKAGQYEEIDGGTTSYRHYQPGLAWDLDRELLYIAHADEDRITIIDLRERVVKIQSDIARPRSLLDRFIDWIAPSALAKGNPWTSKQAVLSSDGSRLYVAGKHESFTQTDDGEIVRTDATDLVIVDSGRIEEIDRLDLGTIIGMQAAPDGRHLLVRSYESVAYTTDHRLTKLDLATGEVIDQLDLPNLRSEGLRVYGTYGVLRVSDGTGEAYRLDEIRIDLETFTIVSRNALEDTGYRTYLDPN